MNSTLTNKEEELYRLASGLSLLCEMVGKKVSTESLIRQATPDSPMGKLRDEIKAMKSGEEVK